MRGKTVIREIKEAEKKAEERINKAKVEAEKIIKMAEDESNK